MWKHFASQMPLKNQLGGVFDLLCARLFFRGALRPMFGETPAASTSLIA